MLGASAYVETRVLDVFMDGVASIRTNSYCNYSISDPSDAATWQKMVAIKTSILRRMDNEPAGVRLCCIKFIQSVVQVQTPGMIADPRVRDNSAESVILSLTSQRPEQNEISLALVPRNHPVIPPSNLEAEASGLLDRLLFVIQDNSRYVTLFICVRKLRLTV